MISMTMLMMYQRTLVAALELASPVAARDCAEAVVGCFKEVSALYADLLSQSILIRVFDLLPAQMKTNIREDVCHTGFGGKTRCVPISRIHQFRPRNGPKRRRRVAA